VHADPELNSAILNEALVGFGQSLLDGHSTLDGIDSTGEFGKNAITRCISDAAPVLCNQTVHDLAMCGKVAHRIRLIEAHKTGIAFHVSGKDSGQTTLNGPRSLSHGT